jgi:Phage integrase family
MLRHSAATEMIRAGVPIEVAARLLTHRSSVTTSQIYVHLLPADLRAELTRAGMWTDSQPEVDGRETDDPAGERDRQDGQP